MDIKTKNLTGLALITLLAASLAVPSVAQAGGGRHGHHDRHDHHDRHGHHDHHNRHHHHDHHRHSGGQVHIYSQPPVYYQQQYYPQQYYPQPQYNYYPPAPVYITPPRVSMGINAGNVDFMLRY